MGLPEQKLEPKSTPDWLLDALEANPDMTVEELKWEKENDYSDEDR